MTTSPLSLAQRSELACQAHGVCVQRGCHLDTCTQHLCTTAGMCTHPGFALRLLSVAKALSCASQPRMARARAALDHVMPMRNRTVRPLHGLDKIVATSVRIKPVDAAHFQ